MFPPSIHPCGEAVEWECDDAPALIDGATLEAAVAKMAAASLLARYWPAEGGRHKASLALAGALCRGDWSEGDVE